MSIEGPNIDKVVPDKDRLVIFDEEDEHPRLGMVDERFDYTEDTGGRDPVPTVEID